MQTNQVAIREVPPSEQFAASSTDPARQTVFDEPILRMRNIQGSIVPGFNKSHRTLLFLKVDNGSLDIFRAWLRDQIPFVATADEVLAFNNLFKASRVKRKREGTVKSTWMGLSLSYRLLSSLTTDAGKFTDKAFKGGLVKSSPELGDPVTGPFRPEQWLVGGPENQADVMIMIEADDRQDMLDELQRVNKSINGANLQSGKHPVIQILFADEGANLPDPLGGHEHFGFLDGVSQPGLRGLLSQEKTDVLTLRQNPGKRDLPDISKLIKPAQGKPGQDLLYPGEFIFDYPRQIATEDPAADGLNPKPGLNSLLTLDGKGQGAPDWARDGSFLVYRRLRQDVGGFHTFLRETAKAQNVPDPKSASAARLVGSKLIGRWPSGAPVQRVPADENPALGNNDCWNNNFEFQGDTDPITPDPSDINACVDKTAPRSKADANGAKCPFSAHIRKAYPRDDGPMDPTVPPPPDPKLSEAATQTHRLLRRGLPYGTVSSSTPEAPIFDEVDRGLQFLAYQTSIDNQFEFVIKNWVNAPDFKEPINPKPDGNPKNQGGGYDPILGQNGTPGNGRKRFFTLSIPDPMDPTKATSVQLATDKDWVMPTAGGYFFTPSIEALEKVLTV